ncbi:MAG: hypothetical protein HOF98_06410 [Gammaproteobacteria bacterium]|nr:hypothetical protein [Gammaproteobacteria bacterium]
MKILSMPTVCTEKLKPLHYWYISHNGWPSYTSRYYNEANALQLDDLVDSVLPSIPKANRSNVYRTLRDFDVNRVPEEKKKQAKKFKEYEPGYLPIDVTYLPKLDGIKYYLYVAIDRAAYYYDHEHPFL